MEEDIKSNFDQVILDNPEFEFCNQIEFEFSDTESLIYSIEDSEWFTWCLNEDGEEVFEYFTLDEYKQLDELHINEIVLNKTQLTEYLEVVNHSR